MSDRPNACGLSRKHLLASVDASLRRLGTDYLDLFVIHRFDPETPIEETCETLDSLVRAGKVRYLGASSMPAWRFAKMLAFQRHHGLAQFISMQSQYNLIVREDEEDLVPLCREEGIALTPWSPLARGLLAGARSAGTLRTGRTNRPRAGTAAGRKSSRHSARWRNSPLPAGFHRRNSPWPGCLAGTVSPRRSSACPGRITSRMPSRR